MHRHWVRMWCVPALLLAFGVSGCESGGEILGPDAADVAQYTVVNAHGHGNGKDKGGQHDHDAAHVDEQVFDHTGGTLSVGGHTLFVPAGAVEQPALFRMALLDEDGIIVDLSAQQIDRPGKGKATGKKGKNGKGRKHGGDVIGFEVPVVLTLSYAGLDVDPSTASVVWLVHGDPRGPAHPVRSVVDEESQTVSAYLTHFSLYALAD